MYGNFFKVSTEVFWHQKSKSASNQSSQNPIISAINNYMHITSLHSVWDKKNFNTSIIPTKSHLTQTQEYPAFPTGRPKGPKLNEKPSQISRIVCQYELIWVQSLRINTNQHWLLRRLTSQRLKSTPTNLIEPPKSIKFELESPNLRRLLPPQDCAWITLHVHTLGAVACYGWEQVEYIRPTRCEQYDINWIAFLNAQLKIY